MKGLNRLTGSPLCGDTVHDAISTPMHCASCGLPVEFSTAATLITLPSARTCIAICTMPLPGNCSPQCANTDFAFAIFASISSDGLGAAAGAGVGAGAGAGVGAGGTTCVGTLPTGFALPTGWAPLGDVTGPEPDVAVVPDAADVPPPAFLPDLSSR